MNFGNSPGWLLALSLMLVQSGHAEEPRLRPLSLDDCLESALIHNREIQIERINPRIAQLSLDSAQGVYDPTFAIDARHLDIADTGGYDPKDLSRDAIYDAKANVVKAGFTGYAPSGLSYVIGGDYANSFGERNFVNFDSYNIGAGITVRQPLMRNFWIDQARLTIQVSRKNLRVTELGVQYVVMDVINRVQWAYFDLAYARQALKVQEKLLEVRQRFEAETKQQVQVGRVPDLELRLATAEVARAQVQLVAARNVIALAENQLKTLLGDDFVSSVGTSLAPTDALVALPETFNLAQSWTRGLAQRPDLLQMRVDLEKADLDLKYRRNQLWPSLDVVAGYGRRGSDTKEAIPPKPAFASASTAFDQIDNGVAANDLYGVIFSVPLSRTRERANYRASKETREQFVLRIKQREELVLREIDDAVKLAGNRLDEVAATRRSAEYAQAAVEAEQVKLAAGRSTPYVVLQLQGDHARAELEAILARANYRKALAQLEFAEASSFERHKINLELK